MPLCAILFASLAALPACGGARDGAEKELEALRTEIVKLRNEAALLSDRLGALERPSSKGAGQAVASGAQEASSERPPLEVVRLEPGSPRSQGASAAGGTDAEEMALLDDAVLGDDVDDAPRPVLRSVPGGAVIEEKPVKGALPVHAKKSFGAARSANVGVPR